MATRDSNNLKSDLSDMAIGETLELETFGDGDYKPGRLLIEKLEQNTYTITSFDYGAYEEDEDGNPIENDPIENVSESMELDDIPDAVGEFAY